MTQKMDKQTGAEKPAAQAGGRIGELDRLLAMKRAEAARAATAKQEKPALIERQEGEAKQQAAATPVPATAAAQAPAQGGEEQLYGMDDARRHSNIQLAALQGQIESLGKTIVEKQGELTALEERLAQLSGQATELGKKPAAISEALGKVDVAGRQSELDTLESGLARAGRSLAKIQEDGAGVPATMDLLEARLGRIKEDTDSRGTVATSIIRRLNTAEGDANRAAERLERATAAASGISAYDITQDPRYQALERKADRTRNMVRAMSAVIGAIRRQAKVIIEEGDKLEKRADGQEESQRKVLGFMGGFAPKWQRMEGYLDSVMGLVNADIEVTLTSADPAKPGILRRPDYLEFLRTPDEGETEPRYVAILEPLKNACSKIVRDALDSGDANAGELGERALRVLGELAGDEDTMYEIRAAIYEKPDSPLSSGMLRAMNGIFGRAYNIAYGDAEVEASAALNSTDALGQARGAPEGTALAGMAGSGALAFISESAIMLEGLGYKQPARANAAKVLAEYGDECSLEVLANARDNEADSPVRQAFAEAHDALAQRLQEKSEG